MANCRRRGAVRGERESGWQKVRVGREGGEAGRHMGCRAGSWPRDDAGGLSARVCVGVRVRGGGQARCTPFPTGCIKFYLCYGCIKVLVSATFLPSMFPLGTSHRYPLSPGFHSRLTARCEAAPSRVPAAC